MSIQVKNLTKIYGTQKAINQIGFEINKGEIVGFLGPNGAGKSTTMKIITGFLQADGGNAFVCGNNVATQPLEAKKKIGYLPESNALYTDMFVREYLLFVASIYKIENAKTQVEMVIEKVGLTREANKKIGQLSKGYKQRVGLAAAIIHNPEVLILDEPTSGLDPNQIVEIREVIKELGQDKTVLFSSHIMQEVEAICSRAIIINKGTIVADDQLKNLMKSDGCSLVVKFSKPILDPFFINKKTFSASKKIGEMEWEISGKNIEELSSQLMIIAAENNAAIISMQETKGGLEDIFRELTVKK